MSTPAWAFLGPFSPLWNRLLLLGFFSVVLLPCFIQRENIVAEGCTLYSSLIIVISLQLRECRQIAEPRKYYLVRVIIFLWCVFFFYIFCFSQVENSN